MKTLLSLTILFFTIQLSAQNYYLNDQIKSLQKEAHLIPEERKEILVEIAQEISKQLEDKGESSVIFVCTHNSRRSQLSELWMRAAAQHYKIDQLQSFSGGTEVSAFNKRMVDALIRTGFYILKKEEQVNPSYYARLDQNESPVRMFSKKYDDPYNPQGDFIAVMVCAQADKECPFVPGADARIALPYEDPKYADNTPEEQAVYDAKVQEIGREIIFMVRALKKSM